MPPNTHLPPTCAPLSPIPSSLPSARLHWRSPAGSEPTPRWIKSLPRNRTRMTRNGRIFMDFPIRANPRHPCNPCSTAASLFVDAPEIRNANYLQFAQTINLRSSMPKPCGFSTPRTRMPLRGIRGHALQRRDSGGSRLWALSSAICFLRKRQILIIINL
jgi:hypothetical protein